MSQSSNSATPEGRNGAEPEGRSGGQWSSIEVSTFAIATRLIDAPDPSIAFVDRDEHFHLYFETRDLAGVAHALKRHGVPLVQDVHDTAWGTRECIIKDSAGHTLYFGERQ